MHLKEFIPYQLSVLSNKISQGIAIYYREQHDISIPEWRVLAILSDMIHQTAKELATHSQMDKVKISRTMKLLENKGLVSERTCKEDARARRYNLTVNGRELYNEIKPKALDFEKRLISTLTKEEFSQFQNSILALNKQADKLMQEK